MAITDQTTSVTRTWTGVETSITTGIRAIDAAHIVVTTATATLLRGTHYTSTLDIAGKLVVVPLAMPVAPQTLKIARRTPAIQPDDLSNAASYDAEAMELQLDRVTMVAQEDQVRSETAEVLANAAFVDAAAARDLVEGVVGEGPVFSVNGQTGVVNLAKADLALGLVDNTADADKPLSVPQEAALSLRIPANMRILAGQAALAAAVIAAGVNTVQCLGYANALDYRGAARLIEVANTGPLKAGEVQSNGGTRRWRVAETRPNQYMFGADGNFGADDAPAIQAYGDYCADNGAIYHLIAGNHNLSFAPVLRPGPIPDPDYGVAERGPTWTLDNNCRVRAMNATMSSVFQLGDHTYENFIVDAVLTGGVFDCNNLAPRAIWVTFGNKCIVEKYQIRDLPAGGCGVQFGTTVLNEFGTLIPSYEGFANHGRIIGTGTNPLETARANTHGLRYVNCTDNETLKNVIGGVKIGIWCDWTSGWNRKDKGNHFWNWNENGSMTASFYYYGDNLAEGNQHDGPFDYLTIALADGNKCVGAMVNYGGREADADGVAVLFRLEAYAAQGTIGGITVTNSTFRASPTKRIAAELSLGAGVPRTAYRKDGTNQYFNFVSLEPVSIGNVINGAVTVAANVATLQAGSNNVVSAIWNSAGTVTLTLLRDVDVNVPIDVTVIANGVFKNIVGVVDSATRTPTVIRIFFYNRLDALENPGGFYVSAQSW